MTQPRIVRAVALVLPVGLVVALWAMLLPAFGGLQYADYYDVVARVSDGAGWSLDPLVWLQVTSNEHHVPLPALFYLANWSVVDGDNRGLSAVTLLAFAVCVAVLASMVGSSGSGPPHRSAAVLGMFAALTLVGPAASHHVVMGFSGVIWIVTDALVLAAIACMTCGRPVWTVLLLAAVASAGYSTALGMWPALIVVAVAAGRARRDTIILGIAAAAALLLFTATYQRPWYHSAIETPSPWHLAGFVLRFLGSPVSGDRLAATLVGALLLTVSCAVAVRAVVGRDGGLRRTLAPWWGVQLYALANAGLAALSRAGDYVDHALSARYLPLGILFMAGLGGTLLTLTLRRPTGRRRAVALTLLTAAALASVLAAAQRGRPFLRFLLEQARRQPAAEWALRQGVWDPDLVRASFCGWPEIVPPVLPLLRATGHVPFDRPPDPELGRALDPFAARPQAEVRGYLDTVHPPVEGWAKVGGWVWAEDRRIDEVVLVDPSGVIRGKALTGFGRDDVARLVDPRARLSGFVGYARAEPGTPLRAFARLAGLPHAAPLSGEREVPSVPGASAPEPVDG